MPAWGMPANQQQIQQHANNVLLSQQTSANPFFGGQQQQPTPAMMANPFGGPAGPSPYGTAPQTGGYAGAMPSQQQQHIYSSGQAPQPWASNPVSNPFAVSLVDFEP